MSECRVNLTQIVAIEPHTNADTLEIATIYGFQVVVKKNKYKIGDVVAYIPIDSIIPEWLEERLFPYIKDPKTGEMIKPKIILNNHRVRQIRIRKFASQGMVLDTTDIADKVNFKKVKIEDNLAETLGIIKYEPPIEGPSFTQGRDKQRNKSYEHPQFHKYNGLDNIKFFPTLFKEDEQVIIQEKLHGTNARASLLPYRTNTLWRKLVNIFGFGKPEQCYGSNNVQKSVGRSDRKDFYSEDVWGITFSRMGVFSKLKLGETVFGEIVGPGIQANYSYGLTEYRFVLFDVKLLGADGKQYWLSPTDVAAFAKERGFEIVPTLYSGPYNKELAYSLTKGNSVYCPTQKVREGIVIKSNEIYSNEGSKRALKWVSEAYLDDSSNTDFH